MKKIIVAIDGRASTGKSTLAKHIAQKFNLNYIDSGVFYRYATFLFLQTKSLDKVFDELSNTQVSLKDNLVYFNETVSTDLPLRTPEVSANISPIASDQSIRQWVTKQLRWLSDNYSIIMDGRDIGTVVFPNADLKIFVTASAQVRAQRRFKEFQQANHQISLEQTLRDIEHRDYTDEHRDIAPLVQAKDALVLDNSTLSFDQYLNAGVQMVSKVISE